MYKFTLIAKQLPNGEVMPGDDSCGFGGGSCPAVILRDDGKVIIVSQKLHPQEQADIEKTGIIAFHDNEGGVVADMNLLLKALPRLKT